MRIKLQLPDGDGSRRRGNAAVVVAALAILMAAFALFSQRAMPSLVGAEWAERANAFVFVVLAAILLRAVSRI